MNEKVLIGIAEAASHLHEPDWAFIDCRSVLGQPNEGWEAYLEQHIPGAVYADLERDLSGVVIPGRTGRHPLPSEQDFNSTMSRLGVDSGTHVVAYDELAGDMAAARLWWLLKWAGHDRVAVLDGGLKHWLAAGLPVSGGPEERPRRDFVGQFRPSMIVSADDVSSFAKSNSCLLIDSRTVDRYRGENETIDPVAGHIPTAVSRPYVDNISTDGRLLSPGQLKERFREISGSNDPEPTVFYCGSGVTAAHNVLAYAHAGLGMPRLYPGSWSEWITDSARPVAINED
jgi:thiosulfate/3-mercaptopyruvate sulfurtransferase